MTHEDELISRFVDGEATDDERAAVDRDPRLRARAAAVERVHAALRDVAPPSADSTDAAIAAALRAATPRPASPAARTVRLADQRDRRRRRIATIAAVAAALLVAVPLLAIAFTGRGTETADEASTASGAAGEAGVAPSADIAGGVTPDLGTIDSDGQLQAAVDQIAAPALALDQAAESSADRTTHTAIASAPATVGTTEDCTALRRVGEPELGAAAFTAAARWRGQPTTVVVYEGEPDVIVVFAADCTVVARVLR